MEALEQEEKNQQLRYHGDNEEQPLSPKEKLKEELDKGIRSVLDSETFKNWLSTGGKLFYNNYSFRNAMLVWLQKPDASYVMGYEKWKEFGRNVGQGAKGAKILIPLMASERFKGGLYHSIKQHLSHQLSADESLIEATYRLGTSSLEFTMNRANQLIGFKINGIEQQIFKSDDEVKRFIERTIIGKIPIGFNVGTVFDVKDVIVPEYLWMKSGFTKDEMVIDEKGNPIKNSKGETKIYNTIERQSRFQTELNTTIVAKDPIKMQILFDSCVAVSRRKGVPVNLMTKETDSTLNEGAKDYFSREFNEEHPNGLIVIDDELEITEKCAVLFHEMGHADLHKNLETLAKTMGEEKISKGMREIQAEATAFAVASTFGIETNTSSFNYLAAYSKGFELQDLHKSIEVIYKETQALTADIKAELDIRGFNLDFTEKPKEILDKETLQTISLKFMAFATEQSHNVQMALKEMPSLIIQSKDNPELLEVLKYQKQNIESRKEDVDLILTTIEALNQADTREQQELLINRLETVMNRINGNNCAFDRLIEQYMHTSEQIRGGLKVSFEKEPMNTLESMKQDFPKLSKLSEPQLQYIASSKYIYHEFARLLRNNPQEFVDKVCERANLLPKVAAKNGTFVEVNFCEQWTDKPFFEQGTLCSPKIADMIIEGSEAQTRGFKQEAEKHGEYFPYTKCDMNVYTTTKEGKLITINTRVDIGNGEQNSLKEHLEQTCKRGAHRKEIALKFTEALSERADKRKMRIPSKIDSPKENTSSDQNEHMAHKDWCEQIKSAKKQMTVGNTESYMEKSQVKKTNNRENE